MPKLDPQSSQPTLDTGNQPDPVIEQAHDDLQKGQVDTDMWATPGLDANRRERLAGSDPKAEPGGDHAGSPPR